MSLEIYKDVPDFEGIYQVSNLGNVKSLGRMVSKGEYSIFRKEKLLKQTPSRGYLTVGLCKNNTKQTYFVHILVAITFLDHKKCGHEKVINHIDLNKQNNSLENLEITSQRENANQKHIPSSSQYTGVCWYDAKNKWIASIRINGKSTHLGYFNCELEAHKAYQNKLKSLA